MVCLGVGFSSCLEGDDLAAVTRGASGDGVQSTAVSVGERICAPIPHTAAGLLHPLKRVNLSPCLLLVHVCFFRIADFEYFFLFMPS